MTLVPPGHHGEAAPLGRLFRPDGCPARNDRGCLVREFISPASGSQKITALRIDVPAGHVWSPDPLPQLETIGVVFRGSGVLRLGTKGDHPLEQASTFYAPTGMPFELAALDAGLTVYLWRAPLSPDREPAHKPQLVSTLFDDTNSFRPRLGPDEPLAPATMNFLHWPGTGSPMLCLHCGIQQPRQTFLVHQHPDSEELFIAFSGRGECFLNGEWHPMQAGDVLFAPAGLLHGARNANPDGEPFITCGGPCPYDPELYRLGGYASQVR